MTARWYRSTRPGHLALRVLVFGGIGLLLAILLTSCGSDDPKNTDPRIGRVVTQDSNCAWGDCTYDFHVCVGPDLLVHISSADPEDHMVKNSPECAS